jgi:mycofactocin precursor
MSTDVITDSAADATEEPTVDTEVLVEDELLVEEVSIDGMCGVY